MREIIQAGEKKGQRPAKGKGHKKSEPEMAGSLALQLQKTYSYWKPARSATKVNNFELERRGP